ncbi:TIGR02391 family protein [Micromonospora sp. 4G57]|uniref:TIGR02391 family protein n=1 Tax=Micromonospora sicca TaxID=2202420 RepID=A0ABU5JGA5_9ACTN|nr:MULTISPECIES: TIGR02391 family protein [unclassified Micromonospora]MDZ5445745.1 TIGR02391 family protein [Micromonospora sp. 4G57]MDZ5491653.1 TIGR02391 family protein [Micromonospora sp. 4G53]
MRPAAAVGELEKLKDEIHVTVAGPRLGDSQFSSWETRVRAVLSRAFGKDSDYVSRFDKISYSPWVYYDGMPQSVYDESYQSGVSSAIGLLEGAIYELRLATGDEPVDEHAYDPELWAHVKTEVEDGEWGKVASQTAIFVENHIRTWAGNPQDQRGNNLVGKNLYLEVFGDASDYRLGRQASEREGWRYLGMGFAQALSNVDRHRIQTRDDAKRYALGVLGLGSLLLTQLRYEHGDILKTET